MKNLKNETNISQFDVTRTEDRQQWRVSIAISNKSQRLILINFPFCSAFAHNTKWINPKKNIPHDDTVDTEEQ